MVMLQLLNPSAGPLGNICYYSTESDCYLQVNDFVDVTPEIADVSVETEHLPMDVTFTVKQIIYRFILTQQKES
jgi:hypothetical protein